MKVVYKYPFPIREHFTLALPRGAEVLAVQIQGETPCLWALVDLDAPEDRVAFQLYGTGHTIAPVGLRHVATFQEPPFVWHLFRADADAA